MPFRDLKVGKKIGFGFGLNTLILMAVVLFTIHQVKTMEAISQRVAEIRTPTAHASLMMLNGVNHSLASLRAWVLLGEDKFKDERSEAWTRQIDPSLQTMKQLSSKWTEAHNTELLKSIEEEIEKFRLYQKKIEEIAQTSDNQPAHKMLFEKATPLELTIISYIDQIIIEELNSKSSTKRKNLTRQLAEMKTTISQAMEKAEEFLLSGNEVFKSKFEDYWDKNARHLANLKKNRGLLSPKQKIALETLAVARNKLGEILKEIVKIRSGEQWNLAHYWLSKEAVPTAFKLRDQLNTMHKSQELLLEQDVGETAKRTHFLITLLVMLFFASALMSGILGSYITRSINGPILEINKAARQWVEGATRVRKITHKAKDELGELTENFNQLLEKYQKKK